MWLTFTKYGYIWTPKLNHIWNETVELLIKTQTSGINRTSNHPEQNDITNLLSCTFKSSRFYWALVVFTGNTYILFFFLVQYILNLCYVYVQDQELDICLQKELVTIKSLYQSKEFLNWTELPSFNTKRKTVLCTAPPCSFPKSAGDLTSPKMSGLLHTMFPNADQMLQSRTLLIFYARRALHHPYPRVFYALRSFARIERSRW